MVVTCFVILFYRNLHVTLTVHFMKKLFTTFFTLLSLGAVAQVTWSAPVTVAASSYSNLHPRITLDKNGNPLVLWGKTSNNMAYFSRWTGVAFSTPVMANPMSIPVFTADWAGPDIASHGDTVYIVFKKTPETDSTNYMYMVRSFNGGQTFDAPVRIDAIGDSVSRFPIVTTEDNGNPIVAFMKFDPGFGNARWVVTRSMNYGTSFMPDVMASSMMDDVCDCCPASILSKGSNKIMLYRNNASNIRTMYAGISTNNGASFGSNVQIDSTNWMVMACPSSGPDGVILGDTVYSSFMSSASGSARVYKSKMSISTGATTSTALITGTFAGLTGQNFPRMAGAGTAGAIVWKENANSTTRVCMSFTDTITQGFPAAYDTIASGSISNADIAMKPGTVYVVWQDDNSGSVMYRKGTYPLPTATVEGLVKSAKAVEVYPNPAQNYFSVKDVTNIATCTLIDMAGRSIDVTPENKNGSVMVSVVGLSKGQYFVLLSDAQGMKYSSKIVIQ